MQAVIGRRIRELRKKHNPAWTINHLAVQAQVDPGQLSRAERGLAGLSIDAMSRVATLLGIRLAELIDPECSSGCRQVGSTDTLIQHVTDNIWNDLDGAQLNQCSKAELDLIRHHICSSIEEGIKRGQIQAEREIEIILNQYS